MQFTGYIDNSSRSRMNYALYLALAIGIFLFIRMFNLDLSIYDNMKYEKQNIDEKFMSSVISFIYLYFIIFFIVTSLLTINGLDLVSALSAAATAISNVGPGLGDTIGPNGNFAEISNNSKWITGTVINVDGGYSAF